MRYLSLFSGIEAFTAAVEPLSWEAVAFAENAAFPSAVLAHHYPNIKNLGSVTEITDDTIRQIGPVDIVMGGSPCQDLSVAGKGKGLSGDRSGLFYEQVRIFNAARTLCGARFHGWENVPGAFSSNKGADFAIVLSQMAGADIPVPRDGWQTSGACLGPNGLVEWRVLDAQYVRVESHPGAVPQRRRRVFVILDTGDWQNRPPILLEPEGLRRNTPPRRETEKDVAGTITASAARSRGCGQQPETLVPVEVPEVSKALKANTGGIDREDMHTIIPELLCLSSGQTNAELSTDLSATLNCNRDGAPIIAIPIHDQATRYSGKRDGKTDGKGNGLGVGKPGDPCPTLTSGDKHAVAFNCRQDCDVSGDIGGPLDASSPQAQAIAFQPRFARNGRGAPSDVAYPLMSESGKTGKGDSAQCVAIAQNQRGEVIESDVVSSLSGGGGIPGQGYASIRSEMVVRRLTHDRVRAAAGISG